MLEARCSQAASSSCMARRRRAAWHLHTSVAHGGDAWSSVVPSPAPTVCVCVSRFCWLLQGTQGGLTSATFDSGPQPEYVNRHCQAAAVLGALFRFACIACEGVQSQSMGNMGCLADGCVCNVLIPRQVWRQLKQICRFRCAGAREWRLRRAVLLCGCMMPRPAALSAAGAAFFAPGRRLLPL